MAKVKFTRTVKLDVLGKWQQQILDTVQAKLPGSKAEFVPLPMGKAALVVRWKGFHGHDVTEREQTVRGAIIEKLSASVSKRVSMILALTPAEAAGRNDR